MLNRRLFIALVLAIGSTSTAGAREELTHSAIGVTRSGLSITLTLGRGEPNLKSDKRRVLLIGGLDGSPTSVRWVGAAVKEFHQLGELQNRFTLSAVASANPEGVQKHSSKNSVGGDPSRNYPPEAKAYNDLTNPEAIYLWRWIGMYGPDLVVDVRQGPKTGVALPDAAAPTLKKALSSLALDQSLNQDDLCTQLTVTPPCQTGTVAAVRLHVTEDADGGILKALLTSVVDSLEISEARRELQRRLNRTPLQVARELAQHYGRSLNRVEYILSVALVGRRRLGDLTDDPSHAKDVMRLVEPYRSGRKPTYSKQIRGSTLAGHLIFGELARHSDDPAFVDLVAKAAAVGRNDDGSARAAVPSHNEMSDAVFMACPLLAQAGRLTGNPAYFETCLNHLRFMQELDLREDGLYRHSPLDEAAWGRGNGFPALGLAWTLSELPKDAPQRNAIAESLRTHLRALVKHQDPTGAWHQVIDRPESYRELTSTCMITFAMIRGVRLGVLDEAEFAGAIQKGWEAAKTRIGPNGRLVDVCTGTGKQKDLRSYYDRPAILGPDPRGGAMALLLATEMAGNKGGE